MFYVKKNEKSKEISKQTFFMFISKKYVMLIFFLIIVIFIHVLKKIVSYNFFSGNRIIKQKLNFSELIK